MCIKYILIKKSSDRIFQIKLSKIQQHHRIYYVFMEKKDAVS